MINVVRSFRDITRLAIDPNRPVVTLFSGGLDSSYLLHHLAATGFSDVHAVSVDVGADEDLRSRRQIAERLGATFHSIDGRAEFTEEFVAAAIRAHSVYLDTHPVSSSLSRPLMARVAVRTAEKLGASVILHTANRSQNTLRRLNGALKQLGYAGRYGSPYAEEPVDRAQKIDELKQAGILELADRTESSDSNLWCREFESGILDDPEWHEVPLVYYRWTAPTMMSESDKLSIEFRQGLPVAVNGQAASLSNIIDDLNHHVGSFGIGRYTGLEHLDAGEKVLEIREMPAATILLRTRRHLETAVLDAETIREKISIEQVWVREALEGRWFGELRSACQAFVDSCAERITGCVTWKLSPGSAETLSIVAEEGRYLRSREGWERALHANREGAQVS
ncbi:argininosuccinate synthase-related protein [Streptomyces olivaceus]|uniref:argininosuccinate synthase-related protein n=1 Tax=Streptomyces olivaceus TaxID=47716 RepID=UPI001CCB24BD|nr:argininosuccinate synthase-related protein [Streptomyces olivaceus]MBZ6081332.1 argininosuccinate synthase-related protein [Streptomyces olivaceus]